MAKSLLLLALILIISFVANTDDVEEEATAPNW